MDIAGNQYMYENLFQGTNLTSPDVIDYIAPHPGELPEITLEACGFLVPVIGLVGGMFISSVAPALAASIGLSGFLGGIMGAGLGGFLGSALVGGVLNAGLAYALGARGSSVWTAGITGGLGAGFAGLHAASTAFPGGTTAQTQAALQSIAGSPTGASTLASVPGTVGGVGGLPMGPETLAPAAGLNLGGASAAGVGAQVAPLSQNILSNLGAGGQRLLAQLGGNQQQLAALLTQAVAGHVRLQGVDNLVAARAAQLHQLDSQMQGAYSQQLSLANEAYNLYKQQDPRHFGLIAAQDYSVAADRQTAAAEQTTAAEGGGLNAAALQVSRRQAGIQKAAGAQKVFNSAYAGADANRAGLLTRAASMYPNPAAYDTARSQLFDLRAQQQQAHNNVNQGWANLVGDMTAPQGTAPNPWPAHWGGI